MRQRICRRGGAASPALAAALAGVVARSAVGFEGLRLTAGGRDAVCNGDLKDGWSYGPSADNPKPFASSSASSQSLSVTPDEFSGTGVATVTWAGIVSPSEQDWISVACPRSVDDGTFVDWFWASRSPTSSTGAGSLLYRVHDARAECELRYFVDNGTHYVKAATSKPIRFAKGVPQHVRLALTSDPTQMRVQWTSNIDSGVSTVVYGTSPEDLRWTQHGNSSTYAAGDLCGPPATTRFIDPGFTQDVLLSGLSPTTKYYYKVFQDGFAPSDVMNFTTPGAMGPDHPPFSVSVFADMGIYEGKAGDGVGTAKNVEAEVDRGSSLIVHPGDISYARSAAFVWDKWLWLVQRYSARVPYMFGPGNHEVDAAGTGYHPSWGNFGDDSGGECGVPLKKRFHMPDPWQDSLWYSFDYQSTHWTMVNSEDDLAPGSPQHQWLQNDLRNMDRERTPWLIVTLHRPVYNSERYESDFKVSEAFKDQLEPLLLQYKVDVVIAGHYHSYQRTCPVANRTCTKDGAAPVHITVGSAGASLDNVGLYDLGYSRFFEDSFGIGRLTVVNKSAMHWEYMRNDQYPKVRDEVWFYH